MLVALAIVGLATPLPVFAQAGGQTGNLAGSVTNPSGAGVANARVSVASASGSFTRTTDASGRFNFLGIPTDTYTISITAGGFQTYTQSGITVAGGVSVALGAVQLATATQTIGRVLGRSTSSAFQPSQTIPQYTVSGGVLLAAQGKQASANETAALLAVPGFQLDASQNLTLRGSIPDEIHYQFDGVDFTDPAFTQNINGSFFNGIGSLQVVPGAGDPSQGDAGAGVVNLIVKRGTNPGSGLIDAEVFQRPAYDQFNVQYGYATPNGKLSDYFSYFSVGFKYQIGPFGSSAFDETAGGSGVGQYGNSAQTESDFVNNLVYRFGKDNAQSLQFLYLSHAETTHGNYGAVPAMYSNVEPDTLAFSELTTGLTQAQVQQLQSYELGQTSLSTPLSNIINLASTSLMKFEYNNQLSNDTFLDLRFFHSDSYIIGAPTGTLAAYGSALPLSGQTSGGSRTGLNFVLSQQLGSKNLFTISGNYQFTRPNFGGYVPIIGMESVGAGAIDFLTPPNPNAPVSATNPCPVTGGCYLQQYFYKTGGTPQVPAMFLSSYQTQQLYGVGLRDQFQLTSAIKLDLGVRFDYINNGFGQNLYNQDVNVQPVPGNVGIYYPPNYAFANEPHYTEPRVGLSWNFSPNDTISLTYGKSINLNGAGEFASPNSNLNRSAFANIPANIGQNGYTAFVGGNPFTGNPVTTGLTCFPTIPFPIGATVNSQPSYNGTVAGANPTLQLGKPCANYAQMLYFAQDAYYPEVVVIPPATFDNFDFSYAHQWKSGFAVKLNPFFRQGYNVQAITAPLVFNPVTQVYQFGSLTSLSKGQNTTSGVGLNFTAPDRPSGLTGFISFTYVNEFTNTPPAGDNPYSQDQEPVILPQSIALGQLYRAGFISPFSIRFGPSYKTKFGLRVNPVLNYNIGYPINPGLQTPYAYNGTYLNVPNTNLTDQYGPAGAPQYVDPANPGSIFAPNVAATRGTPESTTGGGVLSNGLLTGDVTVEYQKPGSRLTLGVQVLDVFNNGYFTKPAVNLNWYPVVQGVGGPLTGQTPTYLGASQYGPLIANGTYPFAPYIVAPYQSYQVGGTTNLLTPTTLRIYVQYAL